MNDPVQVRQYVRRILALRPDDLFSEVKIFEGVKRFTRDPLTVDELKEALLWNCGRSLVAAAPLDPDDKDAGDGYRISKAGMIKEGFHK